MDHLTRRARPLQRYVDEFSFRMNTKNLVAFNSLKEANPTHYLHAAYDSGYAGQKTHLQIAYTMKTESFASVIKQSLGTEKKGTFIDLFCGIGGFHYAASSFGYECVFASDIDKECRKAYGHNHGIEPCGDIIGINKKTIPDHDLLCAGFPCQPFSIIGQRKGFDDMRGTLFFEIAKTLEAKKPPMIVLENVKQLVGHDKGDTLKKIMETLSEIGYHAKYKVFNALDFGVPQKRERVLIVGFLSEAAIEAFEWPQGGVKMKPLTEILEKKPDPKHRASDPIRESRKKKHKSEYKPGIWHENKSGNVSSYPYSCALRAGASYNYLLVDGKRRLTPREMLRLQGFPNSFEIVTSDSQVRKQAGNSVPVPMVAAVIEQVIHAQKAETERAKATKKRPARAKRASLFPNRSAG